MTTGGIREVRIANRDESAAQEVKEGAPIAVLEAMKMKQPPNAHRSGTIVGLTATAGASVTSGASATSVTSGATICEIKES